MHRRCARCVLLSAVKGGAHPLVRALCLALAVSTPGLPEAHNKPRQDLQHRPQGHTHMLAGMFRVILLTHACSIIWGKGSHERQVHTRLQNLALWMFMVKIGHHRGICGICGQHNVILNGGLKEHITMRACCHSVGSLTRHMKTTPLAVRLTLSK